ncbi:hypothetical protein MRX96_018056 [Rhipicephalus microplus]
MSVPLSLYILGGASALEPIELCVVRDELAEEEDALLTPNRLEKLKGTRSEQQTLTVKIVRAEQNAAEDIDREDEVSTKEKPDTS